MKNSSAKEDVTTLEHPTYSPGPPLDDFYLFPWLKSELKGQLPEMFPAPLQSLAEVYSCTRELFWRKDWLYSFLFLRNKMVSVIFRSYHVHRIELILIHNSYNKFLFHRFLSVLHVSNESSRSSSGARHNILRNTIYYAVLLMLYD